MKKLFSITALSCAMFVTAQVCAQNKPSSKSKIMTFPSKTISTAIAMPKAEVYRYASHPEHLPEWIAFIKSITKKSGNTWTAKSDLGEIELEFVAANDFGVIDHIVTLPDGSRITNTLRVIENGDGAEVSFTLFQLQGKTREDFEKDAGLVKIDLAKLKQILEAK